MIEREDFDLWLASPITAHMLKRHAEMVEQFKGEWMAYSWEGQETNPLKLADLRARAEVANDIVTMKYEDFDDSSSETKADAKG